MGDGAARATTRSSKRRCAATAYYGEAFHEAGAREMNRYLDLAVIGPPATKPPAADKNSAPRE
jgi:hypothetical protein